MSCNNPYKGFVVSEDRGDGKMDIRLCGNDIVCLWQYTGIEDSIWKKSRVPIYGPGKIAIYKYIDIPCGRCLGCRLDRSRRWADRCMLEASLHEHNWFVTLTYNDSMVPDTFHAVGEDPNYESPDQAVRTLTLRKSDLQKFFKRLREQTGQSFRYFACGEYGSAIHTHRPHYHVLFFGLDLQDLIPFGKPKNGYQYYRSKTIELAWSKEVKRPKCRLPFGHVLVGEVNWSSCAYTARYILKKHLGEKEYYEDLNIEPEFTVMSRRPGIAAGAWSEEWLDDGHTVMFPTATGHKEVHRPLYFDRFIELTDPVIFANIKNARKEAAIARLSADLTGTDKPKYEYLRTREANLADKNKRFIRPFEAGLFDDALDL